MSARLRLIFLFAPMLVLGALAMMIRQSDQSTTEASQGQLILWGDGECNDQLAGRDVHMIRRNLVPAQPISQTEPCPDVGALAEMTSPTSGSFVFGDLLCDGSLDVVDGLALVRYLLGKSAIEPVEPCPALGETVEVVSWETPTPNVTAPPPAPIEGRDWAPVEIYIDTNGVPVGALHITAEFDPSQFAAELWGCIDDCFLVDETAYVIGINADGFPEGMVLRLLGTVAADTEIDIDIVTLTDTQGNPIAGTLRTEPRVIRRYVRGDMDCDGVLVSTYDLMPFLRILGGAPGGCAVDAEPGVVSHPGDIDCDGSVTPRDLLLELMYFANGNDPPEVVGCDPIGT